MLPGLAECFKGGACQGAAGAVFFVLFCGGFAVIMGMALHLLSVFSGWRLLAERFPARDDLADEAKIFRFASCLMGKSPMKGVSYNGCLRLRISAAGLGMAVFPLLRPWHPPLLIPWEGVESVTKNKGPIPLLSSLTLRIADFDRPLRFSGKKLAAEIMKYKPPAA